jgi:hypothetical protein
MLSRQAGLRSQSLLLFALFLSALLLGGRASATTITYDVVSLGNIGESPFSGIFTRSADDDDDDDDAKDRGRSGHDDDDDAATTRILSDDLSGLIGLATDDSVLFVEGQQLLVEQFSLAGTASFCGQCRELAISIDLDPRFDSVLTLNDGTLTGEIRLLLMLDGRETRELTVSARGETTDPESNFATPDFLSLLLGLDFSKDARDRPHDDDSKQGLRDDDDDDGGRVFLQAQGPVVPEPSTFLLLGGALLGLAIATRR